VSALIKGLAKKMSSMSTDGPFGGRDIPDQVTNENLNGEAFLMFAKLRERAATIPSLAWLTGHARDAVRIAVCFAGFDCRALVDRLIHAKRQGERVNVATVYRVMGEMSAAWDAHSREERACRP